MSENEHVHIGMPVYNGEAHLAEALDSLLNQTYDNFEIFLVDNASTDGTADIASTFALKDQRILYIRQQDWLHATDNWLRTFELAAPGSRYFMWASDDDLWDKSYIESLLPPLLESEDVVLSFPQVDTFDKAGHTLETLYRDVYPAGLTACKRIHSIINSGKFSAIYGLIRTSAVQWSPCLYEACFGADLWFLIRMATAGRFHIVKRPLFFKRSGGISETNGDPSTVRDPSKIWNIGKKEWDLIDELPVGYSTKLYLFYRLRLCAKRIFLEKDLEWFLHPIFWAHILHKNARALGIRSRLRASLHGKEAP